MFHSRYLWLWLLTPDGVLVEVNHTALEAVDVDRSEVVWQPVWDTPWFEGDPSLRAQLRQAVGLAAAGEDMRYLSDVFALGGPRRLDLNLRPYTEPGGAITLLILEANDRSEMRALERKVQAVTKERDQVMDAVDAGIVVHAPDLAVRYANGTAKNLLGGATSGLNGPSLPAFQTEHGAALPDAEHPATRVLRDRLPRARATLGMARKERTLWLDVDAWPLHDPEQSAPRGAVVVYRPIGEVGGTRDAGPAAAGATQLAPGHDQQRDQITGLPDRAAFATAVRQVLDDRGEGDAVLLLDLDGFSALNTRRGNGTGDRLLRWFARQLERCIRPDDVAARVGADEFALLLRRVRDDDGVRTVAGRIARELQRKPWLDGTTIDVSASMGWAMRRATHDTDGLLRDADRALQAARQSGRPCAFNDLQAGGADGTRPGNALEQELDRAIENGEIDVYFQPLVDAKTHDTIGAEALMRWRHPERGVVGPADFVPAAERSGQIVAMEAQLLDAALRHLKGWHRTKPSMRLSLNISARQLERSDFVERFGEKIDAAGVPAGNLIVEVTETFAMQHPKEAARVLQGLAELGVTLAIDDFGTGFSNLGQLQHLPFEIVKIDRGFLRDVPDNQRNFALVRTIIAMAQSLDMTIIAEGVETKTQADFLYWEGATWLQGFHFGRPMPPATFASISLGGSVQLDD